MLYYLIKKEGISAFMAEQEEEIVIIEDSDAASQESVDTPKEEPKEDDGESKKKLLIFGGLAIVLVLIITILVVVLVVKLKKKEKNPTLSTTVIEQQLQKKPKEKITQSRLENLIAKANYLYTNGQKEQALKLYEYIAQYSEAVSQYNLGVARMKNEQYKEALQSFNHAIQNGEKRCVSAINAAVCSLYLKDKENFEYYIDLAEAYLPNEINAPLYPYYYSLIKFYQQNYYAALASIQKVEHPEYLKRKRELSAKLSALFSSDYDAIEALEELKGDEISFSKALLYGRIGDLVLAKANFEAALTKGVLPKEATLGLIYTKLKLGQVKEAADDLKKANDLYGDELLAPYPVRVFLKRALFDPLLAQREYREDITEDPWVVYQKIFYFAPYKIFNANQTINYIRKGNATAYIDSIDSAETFLQKSASTSSVNKGIAQAIKLALAFKIRQANLLLQKLVNIQPKHSILHYNLALTYAQLGDMHNAYKHFIWSYHLDAKHYLPGIFAYMTSKLIHNEDLKLLQTLKESLGAEEDSEEIEFDKTLLHVAENHYLSAVDWLDNTYKTRPIYLVLSNTIAMKLKNAQKALQSAKQLTALLPHEILPHIIYIDSKFMDYSKPLYAKEAAKYLAQQKFTYQDLYFGAFITRYMYIQQKLITGRLYELVRRLQHEVDVTTAKDTIDMQQSLAMALFYNKNFEESYVVYNSLIDEAKIRDARTLFFAAAAAIEAQHHENAIALLELSKLKDKKFAETRYALGLLYFEANNARGAAIELLRVPQGSFHSRYFNFDIDLKKLTFRQQHPNAD